MSQRGARHLHSENHLPTWRILRSIAAKMPVEPKKAAIDKPIWGARAGHKKTLLSDDQVREIRYDYEIGGFSLERLRTKWAAVLEAAHPGYLYSLLSYQTRSLIFPMDRPGLKRK